MKPLRSDTLTLDEVAVQRQAPTLKDYDVYGIFKQAENKPPNTFWTLRDESRQAGEQFKLEGPIENYPEPKPGDVVRIHRAFTDKLYKLSKIAKGQDVVIWRAHKYKPVPITKARSCSVVDDEAKRRNLECLYCSWLTKLATIKNTPNLKPPYDVCGRIEAKRSDPYDNLLVTINDGTGEVDVRVFPKRLSFESSDHFDTASKANVGDFIVATGTKPNKQNNLDISANLQQGRSLRIVEPQSILGVLLSEALDAQTSSQQEQPNDTGRRRSPRLMAQKMSATMADHNYANSHPATQDDLQRQITINNNNNHRTTRSEKDSHSSPSYGAPAKEPPAARVGSRQHATNMIDPDLTKLCDIKFSADNVKKFFNIAGKVVSEPVMNGYGHYVVQLFDGTPPQYASADSGDFERPAPDSVTIVVYRKQKDSDTNEHLEVAQKLHSGDIVRMNNVRAYIRSSKLKIELSANLTNNKSIKLVDKTSELGIRILEQVNNPYLDILNESVDSNQDLADYEGEPLI